MSICVVVPCHSGDQNQAHRLFKWVAEMGRVNAQCILVCANDCDISALLEAGQQAFTACAHMLDAENVKCNWSSDDPGSRDPSGPNSVFRQVAWHIYLSVKQPWLFLEADSMPLCRDWYEVLSAEYKACGKVVMGDLIKTNSPHLSGVAVYPPNVPELFPEIVHNVQGAFDMSKKVLEKAHITRRIQDNWRAPTFTAELFSKIRPEAVIFHANKDGSLIPFLRAKLGMKGGEAVCTAQPMEHGTKYHVPAATPLNRSGSNGAATFNPESAPVIDIFIKSYEKDFELLEYAIRSIQKFATGVRQIVFVSDLDWRWTSEWFMHQYRYEKLKIPIRWEERPRDKQPGYAWQQVIKLTADQYTDAEYIWFHDSDTILTRPVDASELFLNGKPYWLKTPYGDARPDQLVWKPIQEAFVGKPALYELMRRHDFLVHRSWLEKLRDFCEIKHDQTIEQYIMGKADPKQPLALCFSEFNVLGHFLHERHPELVSWVDTTKDQVPPEYCLQSFTHGGRKRIEDDIAKFKQILGEDQPQVQELEKPAWMVSPEKTKDALQSAYLLSDTTPIEESFIWSALANEAIKSPGHKGRIVRKFNSVMAAVKPKMPEGFGKGRKKSERKTNAIVSAVA